MLANSSSNKTGYQRREKGKRRQANCFMGGGNTKGETWWSLDGLGGVHSKYGRGKWDVGNETEHDVGRRHGGEGGGGGSNPPTRPVAGNK